MVVVMAAVAGANPYDGRLLTLEDLKAEASDNSELDAYMSRNGLPDVAESKVLSDRPPWDAHEVTLYYLGTRKEISFSRAVVLGKPDMAVTRYERDLSDADVAALMGVVGTAGIEPDAHREIEKVAAVETTEIVVTDPAPEVDLNDFDLDDPADRAEAAALRAEQAADRVESAADKAETAALRAEKAFDRLAAAFEASQKR